MLFFFVFAGVRQCGLPASLSLHRAEVFHQRQSSLLHGAGSPRPLLRRAVGPLHPSAPEPAARTAVAAAAETTGAR